MNLGKVEPARVERVTGIELAWPAWKAGAHKVKVLVRSYNVTVE